MRYGLGEPRQLLRVDGVTAGTLLPRGDRLDIRSPAIAGARNRAEVVMTPSIPVVPLVERRLEMVLATLDFAGAAR